MLLTNVVYQISDGDVQTICKFHYVIKAYISFTSLYPTYVCSVQSGDICQFFLRKSFTQSVPTDVFTQNSEMIVTAHISTVNL